MLRRPRRAGSAAGLVGLWIAGCLALTACVPQGLAFRVDDRLTFTSPEDRSTVTLPVTLEWETRDIDGGSFVVFVDRPPMPPGETLRWVARDDRDCRKGDGCPDEDYLNTRDIYPTTDTRLVLEQVPRGDDDRRERHRAVIVLLDAEGRRLGESAFEITFDVDRGTAAGSASS